MIEEASRILAKRALERAERKTLYPFGFEYKKERKC